MRDLTESTHGGLISALRRGPLSGARRPWSKVQGGPSAQRRRVSAAEKCTQALAVSWEGMIDRVSGIVAYSVAIAQVGGDLSLTDVGLVSSALVPIPFLAHNVQYRTTVRARYPQVPKFDGEPVCQYYCWDTPSCCGFRNPTDCAACNSSHGCHPKAPCYNLKREL